MALAVPLLAKVVEQAPRFQPALKKLLLAAALVVCTATLGAQTRTLELRPFAGASIPTGSQRDLFKDAALFGTQGALELSPTFHVIGTFGWTAGTHRYPGTNSSVERRFR